MSAGTTMVTIGIIAILFFATFAPIVMCTIIHNLQVLWRWSYDVCSKACNDVLSKLLEYSTNIAEKITESFNHVVSWIVGQYTIFFNCLQHSTI